MEIKSYEDMDGIALDVIKEVGSIGTGSAATALSGLLNTKIRMTIPNVSILGYNEAVNMMGNPEDTVAAVLVEMSKDMHGIMLFLLKVDLINAVTETMLGKKITDFSQLGELEISAVTEVGNIMISSYVSALSRLADIDIQLSVPAISINMMGGVLSVPMIELGYETNKIMMITGKFIIGDQELDSTLLMLPHVTSLNNLMKKLVNLDE